MTRTPKVYRPTAILRAVMRAACVLLAGAGAWAGEGRQAERGLVVPELDLEVWVSTSLRLSEAHTEMYSSRLLDLAGELFGAKGKPEKELKVRPTWCVTLDHTGSIELGSRALIRKTRGRVLQGGALAGGGEERRWVMPVRRRCKILFAIYKRVGEDYISRVRFSVKEPQGWDEELDGGVAVASVIRMAGEAKPKCPLSREAARERALTAIEPPRARIKSELYNRLLDMRVVRLTDVKGVAVKRRQRLGLYVAYLSVHNTTPWYLHQLRGRHFGSCRGTDGVYCAVLDFRGTIPPGRKQLVPCHATDHEGDDEPPHSTITAVEWSLKGER